MCYHITFYFVHRYPTKKLEKITIRWEEVDKVNINNVHYHNSKTWNFLIKINITHLTKENERDKLKMMNRWSGLYCAAGYITR